MTDETPLRCRPGDRAIITRDFPGCAQNIGRIVEVSGPIKITRGLPTWLIRPLDGAPYTYRMTPGDIRTEPIAWQDHIEHPDAWMHPLRGSDVAPDEVHRIVCKQEPVVNTGG